MSAIDAAGRTWDGDPNHPEAVDCDGYPLSSGERCGKREHRAFTPSRDGGAA